MRVRLSLCWLCAFAMSGHAADLGLPGPLPGAPADSGFGYGSAPLPLPRRDARGPDRLGRPARTVTGDWGYVGSDYGLGKPAVTGLGARPDWGRSSVD